MTDFALRSTRVVTPAGIQEAVLFIKNGIIEKVAAYDAPAGVPLLDLGNTAVLPGVIDPHIHVNEPGRTEWEGFATATKAALAGGMTTLVDMPLNASPVTTTVQAFDLKRAAATQNMHMNCGFWGGLVPGNTAEIEGLIQKGVLGFKALLTHSGIDEFPNVTEEDLRKALPILAKHNLPLLVHCELSEENDDWKKNNPRSYPNYLASRPKEWEDNAIAMMIRLCEEFGCRTHIVHLSSANSIAPIAAAKAKGLPLTVETAQHYLFFQAEDIPDGQTQYKCAPPIRERENNEQLWHALQSGIIDFVATDHSPAPPDSKNLESGDLTSAWGGIASLQFALPVLWTAAQDRGASLVDLSRWLAENPAKLIGQAQKRGKIAAGYVADLIVLDPEKTFTVTEAMIQHKHKVTPYLQHTLRGVVEQTYLAGKKVYENGQFHHLHQGQIITHSVHEPIR